MQRERFREAPYLANHPSSSLEIDLRIGGNSNARLHAQYDFLLSRLSRLDSSAADHFELSNASARHCRTSATGRSRTQTTRVKFGRCDGVRGSEAAFRKTYQPSPTSHCGRTRNVQSPWELTTHIIDLVVPSHRIKLIKIKTRPSIRRRAITSRSLSDLTTWAFGLMARSQKYLALVPSCHQIPQAGLSACSFIFSAKFLEELLVVE